MTEHVLKIRKLVGKETLVWPTVSAVIINHEKKFLLVLSNEEYWATPGGYLEPGETPEQAVKREVKEEIGLDITDITLLNVYGGPEFEMTYKNGDHVCPANIVYITRFDEDQSITPDNTEILEAGFYTAEEARALPTPEWLHIVLSDALEKM